MTLSRNDVEATTLDVLAGRAGRKVPCSVGELRLLVAEVLAQRAAAQSGWVPLATGGLSDPDAEVFAAFMERLKKSGILETSWRDGDIQDATFQITEKGQRSLHGAGVAAGAAREGVGTPVDGSGAGTRQAILRSILNIQGSGSSYVSDEAIANDLGLDLDDVQGHLHILEEEGRIQLAATFEGCSAFLPPPQRQRVREAARGSDQPSLKRPSIDRRKVFVVHGRNNAARTALFSFLRAVGLHPLEWSEIVNETGVGSPYIGEVLETGFSIAQAVVVLLTPDDEAQLRPQYRTDGDPPSEATLTPQARPNVIFEAGMALGLFKERTILVELGQLRPMSGVAGRHVIRLDNSPERRQDLAQRLETAGCAVNREGTDWYTAGDFTAALR